MLFDFDNEKKLEEIKEDFSNINKLHDSIADNRSQYRRFTQQINLDFHVLDDCIKRYENALLISCYTFSEQMTKSLIYQLLEKDRNTNSCVNNFINNKINPEKFSPNVKSVELIKLIKELKADFNFILHKHSDFTKYDEMVKCRHLYAHANNYSFQFDQYEAVINVLDYLNYEFTALTTNEESRNEIKDLFTKINYLSKCLSKCTNKSFRNPKIPQLYDVCQELREIVNRNAIQVILLNKILEKVDSLLETANVEENCTIIYDTAIAISETFK